MSGLGISAPREPSPKIRAMEGIVARVRRGAPATALLAGVAALLCWCAVMICAVSLESIRGATVRSCDPSATMTPVVLLTPELSRAPLNPRFKPDGCVVVSGFWMHDRRGVVHMRVVADGGASLAIDGRVVAERATEAPGRAADGETWLEAGPHSFEIRFDPAGPAQVKAVIVDEGGARLLSPTFLRAPSTAEYFTERARKVLLAGVAVLLAVALGALALAPGAWLPALAVVIFAFLLRFEALIARYAAGLPGPISQSLYAVGHAWRPDSWIWEKELTPYVGGDPVRYIEFARQMPGFFDAHVREPVFVAWGRLFIVDLGVGDFGISVASMLASCILVAATFLFGYQRFGKPVALMASLLLAADATEISLSVEGWRDGAFAASFVLALWALHRARLRPSRHTAVLAGVTFGLSCLTRLSALTFVGPALADLALFGDSPRRQRLKVAGVALIVVAILVGPYLAACAVAFGDPLFAVNYHLRYYQPEGAGPTSAAGAYFFSFTDPLGRADTLFEGVTSYPFLPKWKGLEPWLGPLADGVMAASAFGLLAWATSNAGLRILVLTASALVPFGFALTAWRHTLFAYPVYLIAAGWSIERVVALLGGRLPIRRAATQTGKVFALSVALVLFSLGLRAARVASDGRAGRAFTINAGPRDCPQARGFGMPRFGDEGFTRTSADSRRFLRVSLQPGRAWSLTFRWHGSADGEVRESGRPIDQLPQTPGDEPTERFIRLPISQSPDRMFEIVGAGTLDFWSARLAPDPPGALGGPLNY